MCYILLRIRSPGLVSMAFITKPTDVIVVDLLSKTYKVPER